MRQQVLSPDHTQAVLVEKASGKAVKWEDSGEVGRRGVGDGPSLSEDMSVSRMAGGRLKGSSTYHSKEQRLVRDHKDRKEEKEEKEYNDRSKAEGDLETKVAKATEVMDDQAEGQNRRGQDGDTLLQWGQRKRPRYRESPGLLKISIRAERRVVRADKQVAAQPGPKSRGNFLRPSNVTTQEAASGTVKRVPDGADVAATKNEYDHLQLSIVNLLLSGNKEDTSLQPPVFSDNLEKAPGGSSEDLALRQPDTDSFQEKSFAQEKVNFELFEWPKIVISLTRKEKEDDFTAIKGTKLPQRPKRRQKTVEKNVQFISPGTWLCDVTRERYEVREKKAVKKKPRGLKAMGSVDSDSE